jgi:alpha-galactosidase
MKWGAGTRGRKCFRTSRVHLAMQGQGIALALIVLALAASQIPCQGRGSKPGDTQAESRIAIKTANGSLTIVTPAAEFAVTPSGYIRCTLLRHESLLSLDEPPVTGAPGDEDIVVNGLPVGGFVLDLKHAAITHSEWGIGATGRRVEISGGSAQVPGLEKTLTLEVYDGFPNLILSSVAFKNLGSRPLKLGRVTTDFHRLDASRIDPKLAPFDLWSFQGASFVWGQDAILRLTAGFSRPNVMGAISPSGAGGGIPVVAFWTAKAGLAIGHIDKQPLVLSMPVHVESDRRISTSIHIDAARTLQQGQSYQTPRTFSAVYDGDYYEPLRLYSLVLQREGWRPAQPNQNDYEANWCGWGYRSDVTPQEMLGTIPKLKEMDIHWATLDYRWFNNFGDWEPRHETFPDESIQNLVKEFHRQGIKLQLWWSPLAVSDGQLWEAIGEEEKTPNARAEQRKPTAIVKEHPDWLILNAQGKPARVFLNRAALCPALPQVQEYYRQITTRLIRDWGFDGSKLDMCFTVPTCYNPAHHHNSPLDSVYAMGKIFKIVQETSRQLKPDSITQICPCGTMPNLAWLGYEDQAVTADPVGAIQVRRRIKMYKALLGPQAAVYGDHVELTAMKRMGDDYREFGHDFSSTVGTGGVVGTKFVWPELGPSFKDVNLTPAKDAYWQKWIAIYQSHMLSEGKFLNLYVYGYDIPEGYAIAKDGKMFYAFFSPDPGQPWRGEVELRGLSAGSYAVLDYEHGKALGTVTSSNARLRVDFKEHLLLEVSKGQ